MNLGVVVVVVIVVVVVDVVVVVTTWIGLDCVLIKNTASETFFEDGGRVLKLLLVDHFEGNCRVKFTGRLFF